MTDVFISYAREDKAFVAVLNNALQQRGRETWIDWVGIAPSAEWYREILQAIEAAHTIVLVISTHSAQSKFCTSEIAHLADSCVELRVHALEQLLRHFDSGASTPHSSLG